MPQNQPLGAAAGGGFMRGLAGGIAGGFLGSMIFSSLGHAFGADMGGAADGGGGVGLLEILLFAGLAYWGFRWWKSRQSAEAVPSYGATGGAVLRPLNRGAERGRDPLFAPGLTTARASAPPDCIDGDEASDYFFKVQGAWTRRDLSSVRALLGPQVAETLNNDLQDLRRDQRINRLENIAVRNVDVGEPWQEDGADLVTVRFTANLLDYTVDERSGDVVDGSNAVPVKFEEDWTFRRPQGSRSWLLVGLAQV
jgi:predicted lipid-binding transport protein (Tim44 family)